MVALRARLKMDRRGPRLPASDKRTSTTMLPYFSILFHVVFELIRPFFFMQYF